MTFILHPMARTTPRTRAEIRTADPSLTNSTLARRYGITEPTVAKWRTRSCTKDRSHRPHTLHCTLTPAQEAIAMAVRETLWLPLDDLLAIVREFLHPGVSRSGLARCMRRYGLNQRPVEDKAAMPATRMLKSLVPGLVHMEVKHLPQMPRETSRRYLFVAIDRATRWAYMRIYTDQSIVSGIDFLRRLRIKAPMKIQKLLVYGGSQFTDRFTSESKAPTSRHTFDQECIALGIEHYPVEPSSPRAGNTIERFDGCLGDVLATAHFRPGEDLQTTLERYLTLYNLHLPQKSLGHEAPLQALRQWRADYPDLFVNRNRDLSRVSTGINPPGKLQAAARSARTANSSISDDANVGL